ncbi:MAG: RHS repeat-associated core domain-containing protein [Bacteroidota bacterium]
MPVQYERIARAAGNAIKTNQAWLRIASTGKQYNGNISKMLYTGTYSGSKTFSYGYDKLNRLAAATSTGNTLDEGLTYDVMGNITALTRGGQSYSSLGYSYTGNQLTGVSGSGFTTRSYAYDGNGNATSDGGGKAIAYNLLNLPRKVTNSSSTELASYTYDATGNKLSNTSTASGHNDGTWEYINGIVYHNGAIAFISTEEGRAVPNGSSDYTYQYNLKDHLGNVRSTFYNNSGTVTVLQEDEYYSFGLRHGLYDGSNNNRYLYNGKEVQTDLDNQYDYGARFYDPVIGRWTSVDPLADASRRWNPYTYGKNNPIRVIDPDGMFDWVVGGSAGDKPVWDENVHSDADAERLHGKGATDVTKDGATYNYTHGGRGVALNPNGSWDYTFSEMTQELPTGNGFEGLQSGIRSMGPMLTTASVTAEVTANLVVGGLGAVEAGASMGIQMASGRAGFMSELASEEASVFRVFGGDAQAAGGSWTPENPLSVSNFRDAAGLPSGGASGMNNTGRFVVEGIVKKADIIRTQMATALDGNAGGLTEHIIDPAKVIIKRVSGVNPQF